MSLGYITLHYITLGMKGHMGACFRDVFSLQSDMLKYICNLGVCVCVCIMYVCMYV